MSDQVESGRGSIADRESGAGEGDVDVEHYETDSGIVFFDAENPLAWLEAGAAIPLQDCA